MNHFIITFFLLSSSLYLQAKPRTRLLPNKDMHPIFHFILDLRPNINKCLAMKYSNSSHRYGNRYNIDPYPLVSIDRQESGIVLDKTRMVKGHIDVDEKYIPMTIETDFCMM
jgi:hypothetical protein